MAVNLIDLIRQHLSTGAIGKIATALGLDPATAEKAIAAAVPALLAALAGLASKREGAEALAASVRGQDQGLLRDFAGSLGGAQATSLAGRGAGTLSSLFGEGGFARLSGAIGNFAGLNPSAAKSLLGTIAPVALGVLGQQLRGGGANASGLSELLQGQKSSIMNALPSGLGSLLGSTGLVEGVSDTMRAAAASAAEAGRAATSTVQGAGRDAASVANRATAPGSSTGGPWLRRLVPLAIILAALLVAYQIFFAGRQTVETTAPEATVPETTTAPATPATPSLVVNDVELGQGTTSLVETSVATLQGITDAAGAEAALPTLQEIGGKFDAIVGSLGQLAPEGRKALADTATMAKPTLQAAIDKVMSVEGLSDGVKAAISAIQSKLDSIAQG